MKDYLEGYLDILPGHDRKRIQDLLRENQNMSLVKNLNESEFENLVQRLSKVHEQLTTFLPQINKLDTAIHNEFFGNLYVDLNLMFLELNMIEKATGNYERIFDGVIGELKKEVDSLRQQIYSINLKAEKEIGLVVKKNSFEDQSQMETNVDSKGHLFKDRDGSPLHVAMIEKKHDKSFLLLNKTQEVDCLRNHKGETVAKINILDQIGVPVKQKWEIKPHYPVEQAIDGAPDSYWAEVILADEPVNIAWQEKGSIFPPGGAYVQFSIELANPQPVGEITIQPFTKYPMDIVSIKYEEGTEVYHEKEEILTEEYKSEHGEISSTDTIVVQFPSKMMKRITITMKQGNYEKNEYLIREQDLHKHDLWEQITQREAQVTLDVEDNIETVERSKINTWTGWDIYREQEEKFERELNAWKEDLAAYVKAKKMREEGIERYNDALATYEGSVQNVDSEYNRRLKKYQEDMEIYNKEKAAYESQLALYEKYLRDLEEWNKKWG